MSFTEALRHAQQQEREDERPQGRQPQGRRVLIVEAGLERDQDATTGRTAPQVTPPTMTVSSWQTATRHSIWVHLTPHAMARRAPSVFEARISPSGLRLAPLAVRRI
eukprot:GHVT01105158.1.p1 GENE.GHVT01105158.1~~GHVT01105158.1.p1  ORF type:complete len:107 (+),score=11.35 GHVT01105158.1:692-1012(+)